MQAIIFDMDGLMLDSEVLYQAAWKAAAAELGYSLSDEIYLSLVGQSNAQAEKAFVDLFGDRFPVDVFNDRWDALWRDEVSRRGVALKPGLLPLLDWLDSQAIPKAVGTSSSSPEAELSLTAGGIRDRFSLLVTVDQVAAGKPAPDIFLEAARRLAVPPEECWVLEDSNAGVQAAAAAGMTVVMVPDLQVPTPNSRAIARYILPTLHEVLPLLQSLQSPLVREVH